MRVFTTPPIRHWREVRPFAAAAETAGFEAVMTVELGHEPFAPLAFAALATAGIASAAPTASAAFIFAVVTWQVLGMSEIGNAANATRPQTTWGCP